ncbi:serendipity locus protein delta-like [Episyrphus balteatus]|uniref:serendipity locus protein delta-like n=1 Tax=Episyrphus balteatus TaxID=286459 RepID=UPI0024868B5E|nr:serendipity locus protein delta-like [Episyrphus balteatus]
MESKEFPKILHLRCLLCSRNDPNTGFYYIFQKHMPKSNRTIKAVLTHLAKCIKENFNFDYYSTVCGLCFEKLSEYDETMVQLLTHQKNLGQMLEKAIQRLKNGTDMESVDDEDNEFDLITEEHDDHDSQSVKDEVASECSIKSDDDDQSDSNDMNEDSTNLSFQCTSCDDTFKSNRALQMHLKSHINLVTCSVCGKIMHF